MQLIGHGWYGGIEMKIKTKITHKVVKLKSH